MPNDYSAILSQEAFEKSVRAEVYDLDSNFEAQRWLKSHTALLSLCGELRDALAHSYCHECGGSGAIQVIVSPKQYVTRQMAMDAGDPDYEGALYSDEKFDYEPCPTCEHRLELLAAYPLTKGAGE